METFHPIGVFDSGFGGLTVLRAFEDLLPHYDYLYLGDNARAPYGSNSFETVYTNTLQCVEYLLGRGCRLVILACNTASAKALRTIQQKDLPRMDSGVRVLGVIRPTAETAGNFSNTGNLGIFATAGTVASGSYPLEIAKFFPEMRVVQEACPLWVPLVETGQYHEPSAHPLIRKPVENLFSRAPRTDVIILGCTHYPLLLPAILKLVPPGVTVLSQEGIVADSLCSYLGRHPDLESRCSKEGKREFLTTDSAAAFSAHATEFFGREVSTSHVDLS